MTAFASSCFLSGGCLLILLYVQMKPPVALKTNREKRQQSESTSKGAVGVKEVCPHYYYALLVINAYLVIKTET